MAVNTPKEILASVEKSAADKLQLSVSKIFVSSFLAGAFVAMGGLLSLLIGGGFPEMTASAPGLQRLLAGLVFPLGLILVAFTGAELFTGNNATMTVGALTRRFGWSKVVRNWTLVWLGNFAGSVFFAYFLVSLPGVLSTDAWEHAAISAAQTKASLPWMTIFLRGIGANWLVCLAVWLGLSATNTAGRFLGLFFPVFGFVVMAYEHSIANMFFIPLGMMQGASVTFSALFANLLPATLGNIVGGAFFVGGLHWFLYGRK